MLPAYPRGPLCTRESLKPQLRALGVHEGQVLLVHSSLKSLGWVCGGAETVVHALLDVLTPAGTLVVPTHSGDNSDPKDWGDPPVPPEWWDRIRDSMPVFNPATTRSRGMGVIAETVRTWPGAVRSKHPQTSFAAVGRQARYLTDMHDLASRLGDGSPLFRLEQADAKVLLLGVGWDSCTCFHLAEHRVQQRLDHIPRVENCFAVDVSQMGRPEREWVNVQDTMHRSDDFHLIGNAFEGAPVIRGQVGGAASRFFFLGEAVAFAQFWLLTNRTYGVNGNVANGVDADGIDGADDEDVGGRDAQGG